MINLKASARATRTCYRTLSCMPILVVLAVSAANGQSLGAGAIEGTIVDDSGAALPGVTVTAAGPALQVPQRIPRLLSHRFLKLGNGGLDVAASEQEDTEAVAGERAGGVERHRLMEMGGGLVG